MIFGKMNPLEMNTAGVVLWKKVRFLYLKMSPQAKFLNFSLITEFRREYRQFWVYSDDFANMFL